MRLTNPILPGFHPDPSICRVGNDYYLVNSTFCYFPAVPIFHSRDLVHWEQIGNVLDRSSQVDLSGCEHSDGIYAPTIRWNDGVFYMITTNMTRGGTFLVTAKKPEGPWSDPHFITGAGDMDPSLFFDDDGKTYCLATRPNSDGAKRFGDWEIWIREIDLKAMKLTGKEAVIWHGSLKNAVWPEGPHLYRHDGRYYLLCAEGGTGFYHSVVVARGETPFGPFAGYAGNPILTHRHLGIRYPIVNIGHGDLVDTPDGKWFLVVHGSRPCAGYTNLGRETFLTPVEWQHGWPCVNPGIGKVEATQDILMESFPFSPSPGREDFDGEKLGPQWLFLRNPEGRFYSLTERKGFLRLYLKRETLAEADNPAFLGIRQSGMNYTAEVKMDFVPHGEGEAAGLAVIQSNSYFVRIEKVWDGVESAVQVAARVHDEENILAKEPVEADTVILGITGRGSRLCFWYREGSGAKKTFPETFDAKNLSTELAGGFVGCCIGMFATSNGIRSEHYADFDWFNYTADDDGTVSPLSSS